MNLTRRDFLKVGAVGGVGATIFGFDLAPAYAQMRELKIARATETRSTCPYCSEEEPGTSLPGAMKCYEGSIPRDRRVDFYQDLSGSWHLCWPRSRKAEQGQQ